MKVRVLRAVRTMFVAGILVCAFGCDQSSTAPAQGNAQSTTQPQSLPTVTMTLGTRTFTLEVAAEDQTRMIGLMYRDSMPVDHGMIFAFPDEEPRAFWMKNTRIPLDIAYIDHTGKVVSIRAMQPFDLTSIESGGAAKYAIEMNLGAAAAVGLHAGDMLKIPLQVTSAAR